MIALFKKQRKVLITRSILSSLSNFLTGWGIRPKEKVKRTVVPEDDFKKSMSHLYAQNYFDLIPKLSHYQPIRKNTKNGEIVSLEIDCSPILSGDYTKKIQEVCGNNFKVSPMTNNGYILIVKTK